MRQLFFIIASSSFLKAARCSEVLPAVLDSELSVDVVEWTGILIGMRVHVDLGPLGGVIDIWEVGSPVGHVLDGLGNTIIMPGSVRAGEGTVGGVHVIGSPIAKSEVTSLTTKLPLMSEVLNVFSLLNVMELLVSVILDPFFKVAWHSWEVAES